MNQKKIFGVALFLAVIVASKKEKVKRSTKPSTVFFYDEVTEAEPEDRIPDGQTGA